MKNIAIKVENACPVDYAIKVTGVSKSFRIPHERINSVRGAFVGMFRKNTYEEFKALDGVSFEIKKGEFFGIIGRNGSGKSTLLKILAGIYQSDSGKVKIDGMVSPFLELGIGFNPELSGRDNIYLNATVLGLSRKQIDEKFADIVKFSELERFIDQKVKNYSSGMYVRLAFSVAIHANRDILLMDEVLAVGDVAFQEKCLEEFRRYREAGKTVLFVSHDISTVQRFCDRALLLQNGRVIAVGEAETVGNDYLKRLRLKNINRKDSDKLKPIRIDDVEFLDGVGKLRESFQTGEDIVARIHYATDKEIRQPIFGIAIHSQDGIHLAGPNTESSKFFIEQVSADGYIDCVIRANPFFSGAYYLTVSFYSMDAPLPFDYQEQAYVFHVTSVEENQRGVIKLDVEWKRN